MKKAVKALLGISAVGASVSAALVAIRHYNMKNAPVFVEDEDDEEDDFDLKFDDNETEADLDRSENNHDELDYFDELLLEDPTFGEERKLRPGEMKFLTEFIKGIDATASVAEYSLHDIDTLARTSNIACRKKCDMIEDLCKKVEENTTLIHEVCDEILRVIDNDYSGEIIPFLEDELTEMAVEKAKETEKTSTNQESRKSDDFGG